MNTREPKYVFSLQLAKVVIVKYTRALLYDRYTININNKNPKSRELHDVDHSEVFGVR